MKGTLRFGTMVCLVSIFALSGLASAAAVEDGQDVWYLFKAGEKGDYTITLTDSFAGATLAVFGGTAVGTEAGRKTAVPESHAKYTKPVELSVDKGATKLIRVAGERIGTTDTFKNGSFKIALSQVKEKGGCGCGGKKLLLDGDAPFSLDALKNALGEWLLVGLSALVLASWSVLRRD
ncbi:MAG TPA: hypothetical protein PLY90_02605 [Candidatus Hydrogenedentes bacterium]|nr:MAG: hypothetical protein BWY07_00765 [Candidatus Hydrogenedentes bacterium ADurb.Bin170]HNZ48280.1 hypothetical protein [Candidatus Hydrogenedentota bacterium]HOD94561.1 hypothetical protein [Candidatus Hydrogenedentota bacterium]HOM48687.1 hypothetical protein [Candidatus Hydrogenedentota bacterium]HOR51429.1 hypothetical protein [Candidatus Hydrogenedentota bacterium]